MHDRIKFRAYIKSIKEIHEVHNINIEDKKATIFLGEYIDYDFDEIDIMQFTGVYDKNGKEIYEGDIVGFGSFGGAEGRVIWDNGRYAIVAPNNDYVFNLMNNWNILSVIRTIYDKK